MRHYRFYLVVAALLSLSLTGNSSAILFNGDFETGDLSGWIDNGINTEDYGLIVESDGSNYYARMWARDTAVGLKHNDRLLPSATNFKLSYDFQADLTDTAWFVSESDGIDTLLRYRNSGFQFYENIITSLYVRPSKVFSEGYRVSMIVNFSNYPTSYLDDWELVLYNWIDPENIATVKIDNVNMHVVSEASTIFILFSGLWSLAAFRKKFNK